MKKNKNVVKKFLKIFLTFIILIIVFFMIFYFVCDNKKDNIIFSKIKDINNIINKYAYYPYNKLINKNCYKVDETIKLENKVLKKEIESLKNELKLNEVLTDNEIVYASLIKRNTPYWFNIITIDKGSKDNIKVGNAVMNYNGLIGKVVSVNKYTSDVKLLTAKKQDNYISAMFTINNDTYYGLIDGYDAIKNELHLKNVIGDFDENMEIKVYTSGLSDSFSKGLYIGNIKRIIKDKYGISNSIYVTPSADFNNISTVSVIVR